MSKNLQPVHKRKYLSQEQREELQANLSNLKLKIHIFKKLRKMGQNVQADLDEATRQYKIASTKLMWNAWRPVV